MKGIPDLTALAPLVGRGLEFTFVECEGHSFRVDNASPVPDGLRCVKA